MALRGLSLAQTDRSPDLLEFERLEATHQQIASLREAGVEETVVTPIQEILAFRKATTA